MKKFIIIFLIFIIFSLAGCGNISQNQSYIKSSNSGESVQIEISKIKSEQSKSPQEKSQSLKSGNSQKSGDKSINSQNSQFGDKNSSIETSKPEARVLGVWWWSDSLDESYFDFAISRGVNEIYYCASDFSISTYNFIKRANQNNVKVYWLGGEYAWAQNSENLYKKLNAFLQFQKNYLDANFSGVHLDIEPHQNPDWKGTTKENPIRTKLIQELVDLAEKLKNDFPSLNFSYDLPFWLDYEILYNGQTRIAYEAMIDIADRIFLMSYRDTADGIYSVSSDEIDYAKKVNKSVFLGIETYSGEGDNVSFWEEGEAVMFSEMEKLSKMLDESFGFSVHHMKRWLELANKVV